MQGFIAGAGEIVQQDISDTLRQNFMPYAMSVILSRAIPEIDGFKPSHRKLLFTMYKMGLLGSARTKSANIVGQTMKLNPHGDTAIYDTMQYIKPDVQTVCLGQAASAAAILLASGTKGKRLMLPNARVLIHQPAIDQGFGKATEIEIQAKEMLRMREWLEETLAKHTGQDVEKIRRDIEVDTFLTAPEAKEYGIVDEVLEHRQ